MWPLLFLIRSCLILTVLGTSHFSDSVYTRPLPHWIINSRGMRVNYAVLCHPCHLVVGQPLVTSLSVSLALLSNLLSTRLANDFLPTSLVIISSPHWCLFPGRCLWGAYSFRWPTEPKRVESLPSLLPFLLLVSALVTLSLENLGHT